MAGEKKQSVISLIHKIKRPVFTTHEIRMLSGKAASTTVNGLNYAAKEGIIFKIYHGVWGKAFDRSISSYEVIAYLFPRQRVYVSFITALHLHGIVEQIPQVITLALMGHTALLNTKVGTFSVHQIAPVLFDGFHWHQGKGSFLIAEPEKALVDSLYLSSRKKKQYGHFPELSFNAEFSFKKAAQWAMRIPDEKIKTYVMDKLKNIERTAKAGPSMKARRREQLKTLLKKSRAYARKTNLKRFRVAKTIKQIRTK